LTQVVTHFYQLALFCPQPEKPLGQDRGAYPISVTQRKSAARRGFDVAFWLIAKCQLLRKDTACNGLVQNRQAAISVAGASSPDDIGQLVQSVQFVQDCPVP